MLAHIAGGWSQFRERNSKLLNDYITSYKDFSTNVSALEELAVASLKQKGKDWLDGIAQILKRWGKDLVNLRSKVAYNVVRKQVCNNGLSEVVEAFESGLFAHSNIVNVFRKSLYKQCANHYISQDKELSFFQSILFEDKIKRFRKLCKEFEELTSRELALGCLQCYLRFVRRSHRVLM